MYGEEKISDSNVTVLCPEEGIYLSMRAILSKGDEVIVTSPAYQSLIEVASATGAKIKKWEAYIDPNTSDISFRIDDFLHLISEKTKLIVVNFPHNPTGYQLPRKDFNLMIEYSFNSRKSRQLTKGTGHGLQSVWLNDGRHIVYTERSSKGSTRLMILDTELEGAQPKSLHGSSFGNCSQASFYYPN